MWSEKAKALNAWAEGVGRARKGPVQDLDFDASSAQLRDCLNRGLLKMTDLRTDPEWFFEAHRVIGSNLDNLGEGFWIRFTVQYNLFAGTVLAIGNESQVNSLNDMQAKSELGAFGLTEKFAGVSSGMVVETIAEFDLKTREFVITSPNEGAYKNWISQGFVADKCVVMADLRIAGKAYGPHGFLVDFREVRNGKKEVVKNIRLDDMGRKTVCNDLDNAWIAFDGLRVAESCLLDRYAVIDKDGVYVEKQKGLRTMELIDQRLFTGRVAVAQVATVFGKRQFAKTKAYTDAKLCWAPGNVRPPLSALPQIKKIFAEAKEAFDYCERYNALIETQLIECLRKEAIPKPKLISAIAVSKIRSVETCVQLCFRLKQAVGSYALMVGSGFEATDFMQVAKFAEGESYVLMQKLARDRVKAGAVSAAGQEEAALVASLATAKPAEWNAKADQVYHLSELVMDRTQAEWMGQAHPTGIARPCAKL